MVKFSAAEIAARGEYVAPMTADERAAATYLHGGGRKGLADEAAALRLMIAEGDDEDAAKAREWLPAVERLLEQTA